MRMLADSPNMAFLRREAKDLLAVLRQTDADATLAQAQRIVAEEYGFRTWNDLKDEVDRRRDQLPEPPEGLADAIAGEFGLGPVSEMSPVRYEYMGRRWDLRTERGRYIVRPVFDWIDDAQAEVAVDLQERARAQGVLSPVPVRAPGGELVRRTQDQNWRVEEWIDLGPTPVEPVEPAVARRAGRVLAAIHTVAPRTDRAIQGQWVSPDARPTEETWRALLDRARTAHAAWSDELAALAPTIAELSEVTATPDPSDAVITNCDLGVAQVHFGPRGQLVVMHWDFTGPMTREWELATTLFHWTGGGTNLDAASALAAGYRERRRPLPELTLGSFSSVITGWLTWLLHRGWEATEPEASEKRDYAERTVREVLDAPLTITQLRALLDATTTTQ